MKTLVVSPNWIGDALMAQPLIAALRRESDDPLHVLAPQALAPLFRAMPGVDDIVPTRFTHGRLQWRERLRIAAVLREQHYGRAFVLPNSFTSALPIRLASIAQRIGYVGERRGLLLNRTLANPGRELPMVERYLRLSGAARTEGAPPHPVLHVSDALRAAALAQHALDPKRPLFILAPGAEYGPAKRWPATHYAALADLLHQAQPGAQIALVGSAADAPLARDIMNRATAPLSDLTGRTTLDEAAALIAAASGVVSNDSGLMHVAAALSRAQVAIFGSSDPRHTPPNSARAQVVWLHLECSPCFARVCPLGHLRCLKEITPEVVLLGLNRSMTVEAA